MLAPPSMPTYSGPADTALDGRPITPAIGTEIPCLPSGAKRKRFARFEPYRVGRSRRVQQLALPVIGVLGSGSRNTFEFALSAFVEGVAQV